MLIRETPKASQQQVPVLLTARVTTWSERWLLETFKRVRSMLFSYIANDMNTRYINMDYLFLSSLSDSELTRLVVSYDTACQWSRGIWDRMKTCCHHLQLHITGWKIMFLVPKFHLSTHVLKCQMAFSFNFTPEVGSTDGEAPEREWVDINLVTSSTKEVGPGSHWDTLDDHFGDWNWKKIIALGVWHLPSQWLIINVFDVGPGLLWKLKIAVPEKDKHTWVLHAMENSLPTSSIAAWENQVDLWECDNGNSNPLVVTLKNELSMIHISITSIIPLVFLTSGNAAWCLSCISLRGGWRYCQENCWRDAQKCDCIHDDHCRTGTGTTTVSHY